MLHHFSKCQRLYIRSSSMWIIFHLLPLIRIVTAVEVSPDTLSSASAKSTSFTSAPPSSRNFSFLSFPRFILICIRWNLLSYLFCFLLFCLVDYVFLVTLVFSLLSCRFCLSRFLRLNFYCLFTFYFLIFSRVCLYCLVEFVNCYDLFFLVDLVWIVVAFLFVCV